MNLTAKYLQLVEPESCVDYGKLQAFVEPADIEEYCLLCSQAIERIHNDYYPQAFGWMEWVKEHNPRLWKEIQDAEQRLDAPIQRGITLEQFTDFLGRWETLVGRAIGEYSYHVQL